MFYYDDREYFHLCRDDSPDISGGDWPIDADWQPVSAPPTTASEVGSTARTRISLYVNPSSTPGTGSIAGWPPTATKMASPVNVRSSRMLTVWWQLPQKAPRQHGPAEYR